MKKILIYNLILLIILEGCSSVIPANPTAKSILKENSQADILQYKNLIYINVTNLELVKKSKFTKGDMIGKVKKNTKVSKDFKDFYATKLAIGTELFSTKDNNTQFIIAKLNGKQILYKVLLEG